MKLRYAKKIIVFSIGFLLSFLIASFFDNTNLGIIVAICYLGAVLLD